MVVIFEFIIAITNCGYFSDISSYIMIFAVAFISQVLILRGKLNIAGIKSKSFLLLFLAGFFYILQAGKGMDFLLIYWLLPCASFFAGWCIVDVAGMVEGERIDKYVSGFILAVSSGCMMHIILNLFINLSNERWAIIDYFTGTVRSATGAGSIATLVICLSPFLIISKKIYQKVFIVVACLLALSYTMLLGSRTELVVFVVTFLLVVAFYLHNERKNSWIISMILIVLTIIALVWLVYKFDVFGIKTYYESSNLYDRLYDSATYESDGQRLERWRAGVKAVFLSPFGGNKYSEKYYHNFWLDINRVSGIIPMILMLWYNIRTFKHILEIAQIDESYNGCIYLMLCVYIGVFINFFFEPALEGLLDLYLRFCLINGFTESLYSYLDRQECGGIDFENSRN